MAAKKKGKDGEDAGGKKPMKTKLVVVGGCLVLAGGGYMLGGRSAGATPADGATATTTTLVDKPGCETPSEHHAPVKVVDLPSMSINLADGHYLRVGVSLALCDDFVAEHTGGSGGHGAPAADEEAELIITAPAKDIVVSTLSGRHMEELATAEGREEARHELEEQILEAYHAQVYEVFFIEFVMQ